jgi:hypothetical protein
MLALVVSLHLAHAEEPAAPVRRDAVSLGYSAGVVGFLGDLSNDRARVLQEVQVETLFLRNASGRLGGHLAIAALWGDMHHDGDAFPFPEDADLKLLSFLFVANLCWRPVPSLEGCLGLGEGTVNINTPGHRRDYGTWNYAAEIDWNPIARLSVVARGRFIGAVEQQVEGVDADFSLYTATAGVAWTF